MKGLLGLTTTTNKFGWLGCGRQIEQDGSLPVKPSQYQDGRSVERRSHQRSRNSESLTWIGTRLWSIHMTIRSTHDDPYGDGSFTGQITTETAAKWPKTCVVVSFADGACSALKPNNTQSNAGIPAFFNENWFVVNWLLLWYNLNGTRQCICLRRR